MSIKVKIVCPTYKRPGAVRTIGLIPDIALVVRPEEADAYSAAYPKSEIIPLSKGIVGLTSTRQWIYEKFGDVFMLDDDIVKLKRRYDYDRQNVDDADIPEIIQYCANMAKLAGCFLYGFSSDPGVIHFKTHVPIHTHGVINGCALGMLKGSSLSFDPRFISVDDYYISALNAYYHRYSWIDDRFVFVQKDTLVAQGGQQAFRSVQTEKDDTMLLRKTFGTCIQRKRETHHGGGGIVRIKNEFGRTISFPY